MEFDEIVVKEIPGLCRCCLSEGCYKDMGSEYTWMNENEVYADMLLECFDIGISQHNEGPNGPNRLICEVCITRLRDACNFKKQVLDSEKKFVDMIGRGEFRHKVLIYQSQMKVEAQEEADDAEVEYLEEDLGDYADEPAAQPEPQEAAPARRGRPRKTDKKPDKKRKLDERPKTSKAVVKGDKTKIRSIEYTVARRRANLQILLNNTGIFPFRWKNLFICFYCGKHTTEYPDLRDHTHAHGKCSLTENSFRKLRTSQVEIKLDVSDLSCKLCGASFLTLGDIINHLIDEHGSNYDKTVCMYMQQYNLSKSTCPECAQSFVYSSFLINHVDECHPISSFPCEQCLDQFCSQEYLDEHINQVHAQPERSSSTSRSPSPAPKKNPLEDIVTLLKMSNAMLFRYLNGPKCFFCSKEYDDFEILREHMNRQHSEPDFSKVKGDDIKMVIDDLACIECQDTFKDLVDMVEHLNAAHGVDIDKDSLQYVRPFKINEQADIFLCQLCREPFSSFTSLLKHVREYHVVSREQALCPKCGLSFRHQSSYRGHVFGCHSQAIECATCGKDFPSKTSLAKHVKLAHSIELEVTSDNDASKNISVVMNKKTSLLKRRKV